MADAMHAAPSKVESTSPRVAGRREPDGVAGRSRVSSQHGRGFE